MTGHTGSPAAEPPPADRLPLRILTQSTVLAPLGGVETCTLQDSLALVERGHEVALMYGADGILRPTYEAAGVTLTGPYTFTFEPFRPVRGLAHTIAPARWARRRNPDVLWLNRVEHLLWGQAVARFAGCPLVCHLHGMPAFDRMRVLGNGVAHFIAVSDFVRMAYIERGIEPARITRVYNAIPAEQYPFGGIPERDRARRDLGLPSDVPVVLCYGQMSPEKGILPLLDAWRQVRAGAPEAVLVLLDSESQNPHPDVQRALSKLDASAFRVFPIASDVVPFLHACDVVAFPTLLPESFGRVVLEGMATGRPVVASRIGAVPELLTGPMDRFLVRPGSAEELGARLLSVLKWRRDEPELGRSCADWIEQHFPFSAHIDALEAILVGHRRSRRR